MIRWLIGIFLVIVIGMVVFYGWVPSRIRLLKSVEIKSTAKAVARFLSNEKNWTNGDTASPYRLGRRLSQVVEVIIRRGGDTPYSSWVAVIPSTKEAGKVEVQWDLSMETGLSPFDRLRRYQVAKALGRQMSATLSQLADSLSDERVYGITIRQVHSPDSFLLVKRRELPAPPSIGQLYEFFGELKNFAWRAGVERTGYPMMNITPLTAGRVAVETALPIDRAVPSGIGIIYRNMPKGSFLMTEVRGGPIRIEEAVAELNNYVLDNQRTVMAIPFQSFVTDRLQETDTTRWVTRIYFPVY